MPLRRVPVLDGHNRGFWTAGRDGVLRLRRCHDCGHWAHPPKPICPKCRQRDLRWEATSGRATLFSYTLNHKAWNPDVPVPYALGIVELPEQAGLRMTSNIVNCAATDLAIGLPLRVTFEQQEDWFIPLFEPDADASGPENVTPYS
jgi:uncharacterized OB-fold protein